jgi:purine-nucleoside phosphorylase
MITDKSYSLSEILQKSKIAPPDLHIVLGSGLAPLFENLQDLPPGFELQKEIPFSQVPGLVPTSAPGHRGRFRYYKNNNSKKSVVFQIGRLHGFEGHSPQEVVQPLVQSYLSGCKTFILNNAAGSLNPNFLPGTLMIIKDQVNLTGRNPLTGPNSLDPRTKKPLGPRFVDMSETFDRKFSSELKSFLAKDFTVNEGIYLGVNGPSFETPAEIRLFSQWGMGSVGMSTVWEASALRYLNAKTAAFSLISNMGCGLVSDAALSHEEVEEEASKVAPKLLKILFQFAA